MTRKKSATKEKHERCGLEGGPVSLQPFYSCREELCGHLCLLRLTVHMGKLELEWLNLVQVIYLL